MICTAPCQRPCTTGGLAINEATKPYSGLAFNQIHSMLDLSIKERNPAVGDQSEKWRSLELRLPNLIKSPVIY